MSNGSGPLGLILHKTESNSVPPPIESNSPRVRAGLGPTDPICVNKAHLVLIKV